MSVDVTLPHPFDNLKTRGLLTGSGNAAANATLIQARIDASGAGVVWIPVGTWYYDTPIIPKSGVTLMGVPGLSKLYYTGSVDGIKATVTAVYRFRMVGIDIVFAGTNTTAHGLNADRLRESELHHCRFIGFPGNGLFFDGSISGSTGCWSNRLYFVEAKGNNGHGFYFGENSNAIYGFGLLSQLNTLDGFWIGKKAIVYLAGQSEGNGRHAVSSWGAFLSDLSGIYVEHNQPGVGTERNASYTTSTPRHVLHIGPSADATKNQLIKLGGFLSGRDDVGVTTTTDSIVYAEDSSFEVLTISGGFWTAVANNRASSYGNGNGSVRMIDPPNINGSAETLANWGELVIARYDATSGGNRSIDFRGLVARTEGFTNLLTNGGFDADLTAATTVPLGWTQLTAGTYSYEAGTDGGNRFILTNSASNASSVYQDVTGRAVTYMVKEGKGVLSFDATTPAANARDKCQVRVRCHNGDGNAIAGGGLETWYIPASDTEVHYAIPFKVPTGTTTIRVYLFSSDGGAANTDILKVDRVGLWAGEIEKAWAARPVLESGGRLFAGVQLPVKAGAFSDADFPLAPANNSLIGMDTSNNRVYFKCNDGSYKYAGLT